MPIEEWLFRIGGAIILINLFSLGVYLTMRGFYKHKALSRHHRINGRVARVHKFFKASVIWHWRGQEVHAIEPSLFALSRKEVIPLFVYDNGMNFHLNIWTHNGKGLMLGGVLLCASALFLTIVLI